MLHEMLVSQLWVCMKLNSFGMELHLKHKSIFAEPFLGV
jgi:hypothetical protein